MSPARVVWRNFGQRKELKMDAVNCMVVPAALLVGFVLFAAFAAWVRKSPSETAIQPAPKQEIRKADPRTRRALEESEAEQKLVVAADRAIRERMAANRRLFADPAQDDVIDVEATDAPPRLGEGRRRLRG